MLSVRQDFDRKKITNLALFEPSNAYGDCSNQSRILQLVIDPSSNNKMPLAYKEEVRHIRLFLRDYALGALLPSR